MNVINSITIKKVSVICKPNIFGIQAQLDKLVNYSHAFVESKVYGIVSRPGCGAWALSYLVAGKVHPDLGEIILNSNVILGQDILKQQCSYVGDIIYNRSFFGIKKYPTVNQLLHNNVVLPSSVIQSLVRQLKLSPSRMDRPLQYISNERWNASVAIGLAQGKSVFCFPLLDSMWKDRLRIRLQTCCEVLREFNCITVIPSNDESIIGEIADEILYVD